LKDNYVHYSRPLTLSLRSVAEAKGIPVQLAVFPSYASDGLELIKAGIETALIAPPARYTHSPFEMTHEDDLMLAVDLLQAFLATDSS
jgi:putative aminopeptidase FrvX